MEIAALKAQITQNLFALEQQILNIPKENSMEDIMRVIDSYASIFEVLLHGGNDAENYASKLHADSSREDIDFYLATLNALKNSIHSLPFESDIKNMILSRITDNCNMLLLKQFEHGSLDEKGYQQVMKSIHPASLIDTVEVKTWGTKREVSNGLRTILQQQMQGEGVGHASVTMRLKADDTGLALIKKYCLDEDGKVKIPYELKQYGNEFIYEVYWSFWPSGLGALEEDILTELSCVEHKDDMDTLCEMPLELKARYLFQKQVPKGPLSSLQNLRGTEQSVFKSNIANSRIMAMPPAATIDVSAIEPDLSRRAYLALKVKQYKIDEEINSLQILNDNYFSEDKPFHPQTMSGLKAIKNSSNFLVLIKRFHLELLNKNIVAKILLTHTISPEQSSELRQDIALLIDEKEKKRVSLHAEIGIASKLIQGYHVEISRLQSQIKELNKSIEYYKESLVDMESIFTIFEKCKDCDNTYILTNDEVNIFKKFISSCRDKKISVLMHPIAENKFINSNATRDLEHEIKGYELNIRGQFSANTAQLSNTTSELRALQKSKKITRVGFCENTLIKLNEQILTNQMECDRFAVIATEYQSQLEEQESRLQEQQLQLKIEEQLNRDKKILKKIENIIFADAKESKKKKDKRKENISPYPVEIPGFTDEGLQVYIVNNLGETIQLRDKIDREIKRLEKTRKPVDKNVRSGQQSKKNEYKEAECFSFHDENGEDVIYRKIRRLKDLSAIEKELKKCRENLLKYKEEVFSSLIKSKLGFYVSAEELAQKKIKRGSTNNALLRNFNIEDMLQKASELASTENNFHLGRENCSTTAMKLLHAGASIDQKPMFEWHKVEESQSVASNMFITNPQAVYSAASLVARAANGNTKAQEIIRNKRESAPELSYNALLNQFASSMTTTNTLSINNLPGKNHTSEQTGNNNFSWSMYLKFIPHLLKLYRDIFQTIQLEEEKEYDSLQVKVANEIKALDEGTYHLIDSPNASFAIHQLLDSLRKNKTNVPFFETDTLSLVEHYILTIEAKEHRTTEEETALTTFHLMQTERDARVQCIEDAIISGEDVKEALLKRECQTENMSWDLSNADKIDAIVKIFLINYQEIRNKNPLSFLTSNFAMALDDMSSQQKLEKIQQQIKKYPNARSAMAMQACLTRYPMLEECLALLPDTSVNTTITEQSTIEGGATIPEALPYTQDTTKNYHLKYKPTMFGSKISKGHLQADASEPSLGNAKSP